MVETRDLQALRARHSAIYFSGCARVGGTEASWEIVRRYRILVADDDVRARELLAVLLNSEYDLLEPAGNGRELVDGARRLRPDVVIVDVSMPLMNGFDAVKQIRSDGYTPKIIFFTTNSGHAYVRKAFAGGASAYVLKELAEKEIAFAAREVLEGRTFISPSIRYVPSHP